MNKRFAILFVSIGIAVSSAALANPPLNILPTKIYDLEVVSLLNSNLTGPQEITISDENKHILATIHDTPTTPTGTMHEFIIPQSSPFLVVSAPNAVQLGQANCPTPSHPAEIAFAIEQLDDNYNTVFVTARTNKGLNSCGSFLIPRT